MAGLTGRGAVGKPRLITVRVSSPLLNEAAAKQSVSLPATAAAPHTGHAGRIGTRQRAELAQSLELKVDQSGAAPVDLIYRSD